MDLAFLFLAEAADASKGKIFVFGGGVNYLQAPPTQPPSHRSQLWLVFGYPQKSLIKAIGSNWEVFLLTGGHSSGRTTRRSRQSKSRGGLICRRSRCSY